ncbi:MAG TPA: Trm112 family protein [Armatimonadota bacterium]|nr:Trm112 family protein [Armatimonadota bacterium]
MVDKRLLDILVCPDCKADVKLEGERLVCVGCGLRYPVRNGIPIMLVDEAERPESDPAGTAPK